MKRRHYLTLFSTTLVAGCSSNAGFSGEAGEFSEENEGGVSINKTIELQSGTFRYWQIDSDSQIGMNYTGLVREGPSVDFYVTDDEEFNHYRDEERFKTLSDASAYDTIEAQIEDRLDAGNYVFFIDNTNAGEASEPGDCRIELDFIAEF